MKQRITYVLPEGIDLSPADIEVDAESLNFTKADQAAEEWRLTLGFGDLPDELQLLLDGCHELHFRWVASNDYKFPAPFNSRLPPGLHAFFTPRKAEQEVPLCGLLQTLSGNKSAKCHSVPDSFTKPPMLSERFAASSTYQYYQYVPLSTRVGRIFFRRICNTVASDGPSLDSCEAQIQEVSQASSIDLDFDAISQTVVFNVLWEPSTVSENNLIARRAARSIRKPKSEDRIEVGALHPENPSDLEQVSFGGFLTVIGQDDEPKPTRFSFPSRHHSLPPDSSTWYTASFQQPTGLHPKLEISFPREQLSPPKDTCGLHAYMTLPSSIFIDRYQLSDRLFLDSQNLVALQSLAGEQDLEAPEWVVKPWGSAALFQLATPESQKLGSGHHSNWTVTISMHLRYLGPSKQEDDNPGEATVKVPWPVIFWACDADEGLKMSTNPFDRVNLGYDGLFGRKTMFYHVPPAPHVEETVNGVKVPVLNTEKAANVQLGTLIAVAVGFAWVCWQLIRTISRSGKQEHVKKNQ